MEDLELEIVPQEDWKPKVLLIGGAIGLMTGLLAAYLLVQRAEKRNQKPELNAGEGVKVGRAGLRFAAPDCRPGGREVDFVVIDWISLGKN